MDILLLMLIGLLVFQAIGFPCIIIPSQPIPTMQIIEIKPSTRLCLKIPQHLTTKFTIGNLTLRTVCIYTVPLHPHIISLSSQCLLIDAFQEAEISLMLHWSQAATSQLRTKLYDDEMLDAAVGHMFDKETDGNCLMFQEVTIEVDLDSKYLQCTNMMPVPHSYLVSRVRLPNYENVGVTEQIKEKVLGHCEKLGKIKAIYTFGEQYIVQFSGLEEIVSSFCEIRDTADRLIIFGIGCVTAFGGFPCCSPDLLYLSAAGNGNGGLAGSLNFGVGRSQKESAKGSAKKEKLQEENKSQTKVRSSRKMIKQEQVSEDIKQFNVDHRQNGYNESITQENSYNFGKKIQQHAQQKQHHNPNPFLNNAHPTRAKDITKQSFAVGVQQSQSLKVQRKRTKSQQFIKQNDEQHQFSSTSIDIELINSWRNANNFQIKPPKSYEQKTMDVSKKILNMQLSHDQKTLYILLRDCIITCDIDFTNKRTIKFDPIDAQNIHLPTPMILLEKERMVIFANESYLFWVGLTGDQQPDWKYVQRKQIYSIQVIEELNLLMVGGKNFSKLAYLGKSTSRSNIKVYSCGITGKRDHLFTYDIPNCNGQNVMEMKHITTKPNGTKLLTVLTHHQKLFFLRVRAFNHIEVFSCIETMEIGIQEIVSMKYWEDSAIMVCLEKLSQQAFCFKYIKVNCSYQKVEMATESLKMPVVKYQPQFRIGGKQGNEWLTAVDGANCIYSFYLEWKEPEKSVGQGGAVRDCVLLERGAIFREANQVKCRLVKL